MPAQYQAVLGLGDVAMNETEWLRFVLREVAKQMTK